MYAFGVFVNKTKEIQDQVYDEKNNTVRIKVVCCSPEKIRDKICCKGRGTIKSIEIVIKPPENIVVDPTRTPPAPEVKIDQKTTIVVIFFDVPKPCYNPCY